MGTFNVAFFLAVFLLGTSCISLASPQMKENERADIIYQQLMELRSEAHFFGETNSIFLKKAIACLEGHSNLDNTEIKIPADTTCRPFFEFFYRMRDSSYKVYRTYKALNSIHLFYYRNRVGFDAFTPEGIRSLINIKIQHHTYKIPLLFSNVHTTELESLDNEEVAYVEKLLKRNIKILCDEFIENNIEQINAIKLTRNYDFKNKFCTNLDKVDFGESYLTLNTFGSYDLRMLYDLRESFREKLVSSLLMDFAEDKRTVFENEIHKFPSLIFIRSHKTFFSDLKKSFLIMLGNSEKNLHRLTQLSSSEKTLSSQQKSAEIEKLLSLFSFEFLVRNKILNLSSQNRPLELSVFNEYYSKWKESENNKQLFIAGVMVAGTASCFLLPKIRLLAALTYRSLCLFGATQPLSVYMAINTAEQLNNVYAFYLMAADGNSRLIDYKTLQSKIAEHYLSLLILPIGTSETKNVMLNLKKALGY